MAVEPVVPADALRRHRDGALLIDVREPGEQALGLPEGALAVPKATLEANPERWIADPARVVLLICASGRRSQLAAVALQAKGYCGVLTIAGGFQRWQSEGLPVLNSPDDDADFLERYSRHLRLPQVGLEGQRRLEQSTVVLVGAGGLGSPAAFYLAAAGVGRLRIIDNDRVDRSNLQRQILHTEAAIGRPKVHSAAHTLGALNPRVQIDAIAARLDADSVDQWLAPADVVIDGADNFPTRYLISDACVRLAKPLVYGAVHRFEGQVSVFDAGRQRGVAPCYRCLFPQPPHPEDAPDCSTAGVLGVLPGVIGLLQATETVKLLLGIGTPLTGRLLHFDALAMRFRETRLSADPDCAVCSPASVFSGYHVPGAACASGQ